MHIHKKYWQHRAILLLNIQMSNSKLMILFYTINAYTINLLRHKYYILNIENYVEYYPVRIESSLFPNII